MHLKNIAALTPSLFTAFLPKCPMCIAGYAGLLGVSLSNYTIYLLPITVVCLALALYALAYRAYARQGYLPFACGLIAALFILLGKFYYDSTYIAYAGILLLVSVSVWNSFTKTKVCHSACR